MDRLLNAILNDHLQNLKMMRLFMHYFKNLLFDYVIPQHFKMYTFFLQTDDEKFEADDESAVFKTPIQVTFKLRHCHV